MGKRIQSLAKPSQAKPSQAKGEVCPFLSIHYKYKLLILSFEDI